MPAEYLTGDLFLGWVPFLDAQASDGALLLHTRYLGIAGARSAPGLHVLDLYAAVSISLRRERIGDLGNAVGIGIGSEADET